MAKPYRVNTFVRINNTMTTSLLRLGIKIQNCRVKGALNPQCSPRGVSPLPGDAPFFIRA